MLSPRWGLGQARPSAALSLPPQTPRAGSGVASLCPLCPPTPAASLCTEQCLKWKLRHNIHRTSTHTHAHGRLLPTGAGRQLHSREHHGMHTEPRLARRAGPGPALVLTVRSSSPPPALLAARGRAVQGWGAAEGRRGVERAGGAPGPGRLLQEPRAGGRAGEDPGLRYLRGRTPGLCPSRSVKGPGSGVGLAPQLWPASPD